MNIPEQVPERFLKMSVPELVAETRREALEDAVNAVESAAWPAWAEGCDAREVYANAIRALIEAK